ncbi:protein-tyrosine phosphatase [Chytridium lagenaria]|nr:protein-tyrosine phosphatase [Chytridium lagenaria]
MSSILFPPDAFGQVQKGIYRTNIPDPHSISFIRTLHLRSVLILSPEAPTRAFTSFLDEHNIKLNHLGLKCWKPNQGWRPVSEELVKEGLEFVLNVENHPVLVMCTSGIHETGTFIGCLRRLQGWNFNSVVVEYQFYAGSKSRHMNEQFIELFDLDLVTVPTNVPSWFADAQRMLKEEEEELDAETQLLDR